MDWIRFEVPPLPHFIECGHEEEEAGYRHISRRNIGVFDFILMQKGILYMGEEDRAWSVGPGEMLILRPDLSHSPTQPSPEPVDFFWIHLQTDGSWQFVPEGGEQGVLDAVQSMTLAEEREATHFRGMYQDRRPFYFQLPQYAPLPNHAVIARQITELLEQLRYPHARARWQQQMLFHEILHELSAAFSRRSVCGTAEYVADMAATYIREHYSEGLSYKMIGDALNFNPKYVLRCMQRIYGCTLVDYINKCRMDHAKLLLLNTDLPVSEIAERVGFSTLSYFSGCFRFATGVSPRAFRRHFRIPG